MGSARESKNFSLFFLGGGGIGSSRGSKLLEGWGHPEGVNCWRDGVIQRE